MKLAQLLSIFPQLRWGDAANAEVLEVTQDSRAIKPGSVFVAIKGNSGDGHQFLAQVAQAGAIALVVENDSSIPKDFRGAVVKVSSSRQALDSLASRYFDQPANELFCIGVTGTNGKTTTTYMIEAILNHFGWPTGVMGTIDHHLKEHRWASQLTTPDALTLQRRLREFVALGARAAAFEVSSHALSQSRVESIPFSVGIFTNFTRDHLDYHGKMEDYFAAKERLFTDLLRTATTAILNADDPWIRKTRVREGVTTWWFGKAESTAQSTDFGFRILRQDLSGSLFHLHSPRGTCEFHLPCPGEHNIYNAVGAIAAALAAGCSLQTASEALGKFYGAPGRLEKVVNTRGLHIFVDYAHTDDAVRTVLRALHQLRGDGGGRIITVFGCGGDRDKGKRPLMAAAAAEFSDKIIITSDNPRSENPATIISEIQKGIPKGWSGEVKTEVDRRNAIVEALQSAREGDVILVAGKGHEDYQLIGQQRLMFSDVQVIKELL